VQLTPGRGPSHPALGPGWPHHPRKPRAALPSSSRSPTATYCRTWLRRRWLRSTRSPHSGACHAAEGLHLDGKTARPTWPGERLDLGWALAVLHPRATPGA